MRKSLFLVTVLLLSLLLANPVISNAAYDESSDQTISVNLLEGLVQPDDSLANLTFQLQEDAHNTLTNTTGVEADHYYYWVELNGTKILAIDPIKPSF